MADHNAPENVNRAAEKQASRAADVRRVAAGVESADQVNRANGIGRVLVEHYHVGRPRKL